MWLSKVIFFYQSLHVVTRMAIRRRRRRKTFRRKFKRTYRRRRYGGRTRRRVHPSRWVFPTIADLHVPFLQQVPRLPRLFPNRKSLKLCSIKRIGIGATTQSVSSTVIGANNIHQVDFTNSTLRPLGWNEFNDFYESYRVNACKVDVTFFNDTTKRIMVGLLADDDSTSINSTSTDRSGLTDLMCRKFIKIQVLDDKTPAGAQRNSTRMSMYYPTRKLVGLDRRDRDTRANFAVSPTVPWFIHIFCATESGALITEANLCVCEIHITQYTTLMLPKSLAAS